MLTRPFTVRVNWSTRSRTPQGDFFMELTPKQKLTLKHLKDVGTEKPMDIIEFCVKKLSQPHNHHPRKPNRRNHSKKHYQGIIDYLAQGGIV